MFRPEQALATFTGKSGAAANGVWKLRVSDDFPSADHGVLRCWSIFIDTAVNNNTPMAISDLTTIESLVNVVGAPSAVKSVRLSMYLTHTFAADLDISLIAPDGTTVDVTSDNGGSGDNLGTACSPQSSRITFDDTAANAITSAAPQSAPFVGSYRPEQPLSAFMGKTANGNWRLRITDDAGGDVGTLHCWSLIIETASQDPLDMDGDGDPDLLWQHPTGRAVAWVMNGTTYTGDATSLYGSALDWHLRGSGDFTGDGKPDLFWQNPDGRVVMWVMNGTMYTGDARTFYAGSTEWRAVAAADMNKDGHTDLIWQHPNGPIVVWLMNGPTYTGTAIYLYTGSTDWRLIGAADFTADGNIDLIWQHPTGPVVIWVMNGTTYTGDARTLYASSTEWVVKGAADYSLDGKPDLVWQHPVGRAVIWVMNGIVYTGDARPLYAAETEWKIVPR